MDLISINDIKKSTAVINEIRWDVTPKIFINPSSAPLDESGKVIDITHGYMLYVDMITERPALIIMQLKLLISKTVGYVFDIPEDLLREAMQCTGPDCVGGMYPLTPNLEAWLKKELGTS